MIEGSLAWMTSGHQPGSTACTRKNAAQQRNLHVRSVGSAGAQTVHASDVVAIKETSMKRIDLIDRRRAEDLSKYCFA
jgi:hypothetical protein